MTLAPTFYESEETRVENTQQIANIEPMTDERLAEIRALHTKAEETIAGPGMQEKWHFVLKLKAPVVIDRTYRCQSLDAFNVLNAFDSYAWTMIDDLLKEVDRLRLSK
jgi:hypothetical protein